MEGAEVTIHDPMALDKIPELAPKLSPNADLKEAATGAHAVVLATEWRDYKELDPNTLPVQNKLIIDGRNALDVAKWQQAGWKLIALGRNVHL
jgi:UDPglucose 6-dehydrogenase